MLGLILSLLQRYLFFSLTEMKGFSLISFALCCTGEHKIHFIPGMIGPFLGVTLVPQPEVRNIMIPIFHDMMDWEQRKNGNFKQVRQLPSQALFLCPLCLSVPSQTQGICISWSTSHRDEVVVMQIYKNSKLESWLTKLLQATQDYLSSALNSKLCFLWI